MGMASSQVRLLMITNRVHDLEYKAACLQNAKIMLSMLEDDAYQKFLAAQEGNNTITIGGNAAANGTTLGDLAETYGVSFTDGNGNLQVSSKQLQTYIGLFGNRKVDTSAENFNKWLYGMAKGVETAQAGVPAEAKKPTVDDFQDMAEKDKDVPENIGYYRKDAIKVNAGNCTANHETVKVQKGTDDKGEPNYEYKDSIKSYTGPGGYEYKPTGKGQSFENGAIVYSEADFDWEDVDSKDKDGNTLYKMTKVTSQDEEATPCDTSKIPNFTNNESIGITSSNIEKGKMDKLGLNDDGEFIEAMVTNDDGSQEYKIFYRRTAQAQLDDWARLYDGQDGANAGKFSTKGKVATKAEVDAYDEYKTIIENGQNQQSIFRNIAENIEQGKVSDTNSNATAGQLGNAVNGSGSSDGNWSIKNDPSNPFNYSVDISKDNNAIAKASAEYEHELKKIDNKEKQYDTELAKIETERNALTTEMEGLKKVIEDNVERTFGIFS